MKLSTQDCQYLSRDSNRVFPERNGDINQLHRGAWPAKLSLWFNWAPHHESVLGEWRYSSTHSFDLGTRWRWVVSFTPGHFTSRKRAAGTHWIRGWVGPRAVLDAVMKRRIPSPRRESNPRTLIVQPVAQRYNDWAITILLDFLFNILIPFQCTLPWNRLTSGTVLSLLITVWPVNIVVLRVSYKLQVTWSAYPPTVQHFT
jgi:hypothetical protein